MESKPPNAPPDPSGADESRSDLTRGAEPNVLQLFAEEAAVSRKTIESGRVRVSKVTRTRDQLIDELLARTNVEVTRIPVGRVIDAIPPVKNDADLTIIPVVEETLVVERRLVLKEEVHIRRVQTTERYQETVKLRYQTAEVTRVPAQTPATENGAVAGPTTKRNPEDT